MEFHLGMETLPIDAGDKPVFRKALAGVFILFILEEKAIINLTACLAPSGCLGKMINCSLHSTSLPGTIGVVTMGYSSTFNGSLVGS